jgi:hypothetical protein
MKLHGFCVINQLTTTTTKHESSLLLLGKKKLGMSKVSKYVPNSFLHEKEYSSNYF